MAQVIGLRLPRYRLLYDCAGVAVYLTCLRSGDTVNTASRMQSTSLPDKIQLSWVTFDRVKANYYASEVQPVSYFPNPLSDDLFGLRV